MVTIEEQITAIEKEIRETPYHKGTEHHIGLLRARVSRLKDKQFEIHSKKGGGDGGYAVKKQGDATVVLVGPPSSGKSTLINRLTNAQSKVAPYEFTTVTVIPGMMEYRNAKIQILDVPGLIKGARLGKGRGKEVLSVARGADLILVITDVERFESVKEIIDELEGAGVRLNKTPPNIMVDKKISGGIVLRSNIKQELDNETIKDIAREYHFTNAEIALNERVDIEKLMDKFSGNRVYRKSLTVINKAEKLNDNLKNKIAKNLKEVTLISAQFSLGLEELKAKIWNCLEFLTVYLVKSDEKPSTNNPVIVKKGYTLKNVLELLGKDKSEYYKKAKIWGSGSKFKGQEVSLTTLVEDNMQVGFFRTLHN